MKQLIIDGIAIEIESTHDCILTAEHASDGYMYCQHPTNSGGDECIECEAPSTFEFPKVCPLKDKS